VLQDSNLPFAQGLRHVALHTFGSREAEAKSLAARLHAYILVKDATNLLAVPDGACYYLTSGHPALARGGMGDVLAGYTGGLLARGMRAEEAALLAVWTHGAAAHLGARRYGEDGVTAKRLASLLAPTLQEHARGRLAVPSEPEFFSEV
jgi:NAD(P)H-hydrate epimerase